MFPPTSSHMSTMERTTQTEPPRAKKWKQIWLCFLGDDKFRRQRQREATEKSLLEFVSSNSFDFVLSSFFFIFDRKINSMSFRQVAIKSDT